ncbi:3-isopropylmalate dehydrogenase [Lysinibacillus fusiformis]
MGTFFIILMVLFIIIANMIAFIAYRKKNNFYFSAFILLLLAVFFGAIGGSLAVMVIRDPFAFFYGMQIGYFLLINSVIVLIVAIFATVIKKFNSSKM